MPPSIIDQFLYVIWPYLCLASLFLGSLARYDRDAYTWKSDSSQVLQKRKLQWGSNLFHYGVLIVLLGHFLGFMLPEPWVLAITQTETVHVMLAVVIGGSCGVLAFIGMSILIYRRVRYPRIRQTSRKWDLVVNLMLWAQLGLGIATIAFTAQGLGGEDFSHLVHYVQSIVYFRGDSVLLLQGIPLVYKIHIVLGFTILGVAPYTRLVHIWSGVATLAYMVRPYQLVRTLRRAKR
ncbi:MAG: respiratory nitrate reductase subunit gamma [Gammaproteobacteria bacterium]|nr:respiratory nitrate reductase subunit gamma [Gammaproteobacteria bacterium]